MVSYNNIIYLTKKSTLRGYRSFAKKYPKLQPHVVDLKLGYKKKFQVVQLVFGLTGRWKLTQRFKRFYKPIEQYFDILILPHDYLGDTIDPIQSFKLIGDEQQCKMAARFLSDLYFTYFGSIESRVLANKASRKQSRRLRRRWNIEGKLKDARYSTSRFKDRLMKYLYEPLLESLERLEKENPKAFFKGLKRRKRIKNYLYQKYGRKWKHIL